MDRGHEPTGAAAHCQTWAGDDLRLGADSLRREQTIAIAGK